LSSFIFYNSTYSSQKARSYEHLHQVIETVEKTASIAAFVSDDVLAKEVVMGLLNNELVAAAEIANETSVLFSTQSISSETTNSLLVHALYSPFDEALFIGELKVQADESIIRAYAKKIAAEQVVHIIVHSVLMILVLIILFHRQVITAVKDIALHLHAIKPGSHLRIPLIASHNQDEIGMLASDINHLLTSVENQLKQERTLRKAVENLEQRFRNIFENTSGGIALIDEHGHVQMQNPAFEKMLGPALMAKLTHLPKESLFNVLELPEQSLFAIFDKESVEANPIALDVRVNKYNKTLWVHCTITLIHQHDSSPLYEVMLQDISERRAREESFKVQAELDPLTGIYNRRGGEQKAQELFDTAKGSDLRFAVFMIDLDNFKPINDQYGHDAGDEVLMRISERLQNIIRGDDILIRWGGDEFLVVIKQNQTSMEINKIADKLLNTIKEEIEISKDATVQMGASIGIASFPEHGATLEILARYADEAMYKVKSEEKNGFSFYNN
jgi:diguanylate cyclase (GGDEF)-like protein/PAS domain S-box-containing protein